MYRSIWLKCAVLAMLPAPFFMARALTAACDQEDPSTTACPFPDTTTKCAGVSQANCPSSKEQVRANDKWDCVGSQNQNNCTDGVFPGDDRLCYTEYPCMWANGCIKDVVNGTPNNRVIKVASSCAGE